MLLELGGRTTVLWTWRGDHAPLARQTAAHRHWPSVARAGANALLRVAADGTISTVAVFPSRPTRSIDSVPTAVAVGPDGA
jgi:hypothetical protein